MCPIPKFLFHSNQQFQTTPLPYLLNQQKCCKTCFKSIDFFVPLYCYVSYVCDIHISYDFTQFSWDFSVFKFFSPHCHIHIFFVSVYDWPPFAIQSSAVTTRTNLARYNHRHCDDSSKTLIRLQNHNRSGRAMGCLLWGFETKSTELYGTALYSGAGQDNTEDIPRGLATPW